MSVKKFKFVSPGIFINEIDNSQLPRSPEEMGPVIIGRSERGPAMRPVRVESFSEFVEMFGSPISGGRGDDVWRDGNYLAPTYAAYAAQAWLRNASPLTFVRLLGVDHEQSLQNAVEAGWRSEGDDDHPSAYGLLIGDAPADGLQTVRTITINDAQVGDAGFTAGYDADGAGVVDAGTALVERSATHPAFLVQVTDANYGGLGANDQRLDLTIGATTRSINVGTALANDVVSGGGDQVTCDLIVDFINTQHGEEYVASSVTTGNGIAGNAGDAGLAAGQFAVAAKATGTAVGFGAALVELGAPNNGMSAPAADALVSLTGNSGAVAADDDTVSMRQAAEDAGLDLIGGDTLPNQAVDVELAAQVAAALDTAGGLLASFNYGATSEALAGAQGARVFITHDDSGVAGNVGTTGATNDIGAAGRISASDVDGAAGAVDGTDQGTEVQNAALAAVFYTAAGSPGHLRLEGDTLGGTTVAANGAWVQSVGSDYEFRLAIHGAINGHAAGDGDDSFDTATQLPLGALMRRVNFNFDPQSKKYIRKVLNTNPTLTNPDTVEGNVNLQVSANGFAGGNLKSYWLGETFDGHLRRALGKNGPWTGGADDQAGIAAAFANDRVEASGAATPQAGAQVACLVSLDGSGTAQGNHLAEATPPRSGWVFSQHTGAPEDFLLDDVSGEYPDTTKLFRFHGLYSGSWDQKNLKISVEKIKASGSALNPYGSFTVTVRRADDSDNAVKPLEKFSNCSLDPSSPNYIARKIGDVSTFWDTAEGRYREQGQYENNSQFLRVEVNPDVDAGLLDPALVPFGFYGPPKLSDEGLALDQPAFAIGRLTSTGVLGAAAPGAVEAASISSEKANAGDPISGGLTTAQLGAMVDGDVTNALHFDLAAASATVRMPSLPLRQNTRQGGLSSPAKAYWGVDVSSFQSETRFDRGYGDYLAPLPGFGGQDTDRSTHINGVENVHPSFAFSLDDICRENALQNAIAADGVTQPAAGNWAEGVSTVHAEYIPENSDGFGGSADDRLDRGAGSGRRSQVSLSSGTGDFNTTLSAGFDQFTMPLYGGSDGLDIREKEPFSNRILDLGAQNNGEVGHYAYNSVKRAIDACSDPEVVECNLMAAPGITEPSLTAHLIKTCEDRADALAIIDLENVTGSSGGTGDYIPSTEGVRYGSEVDRLPSVANTVRNMEDRLLNSSYGAAYFPWVQVRDEMSNRLLWVPPSVVALGTMASSQNKSELWFAPAGFTRGGLTEGAAGLPVVNVRHKLSSKERDALYEVNINPIASFPSEGIVVFGQKTLQMEASALDRINVRRLMIYLKKEVSRMAATVLFDQNVRTTWARFIGKVEPFLSSVKSRLGLTEYRVILDETTTTPDLIDRNIMYAKIMLKPARAIEFIAIDFVITNSGASFDD